MCLFIIFIGTGCKTERVGIRIGLDFKQPYANQESSEFKGLESQLLSAVSYMYEFDNWDQIYTLYALEVLVYTVDL